MINNSIIESLNGWIETVTACGFQCWEIDELENFIEKYVEYFKNERTEYCLIIKPLSNRNWIGVFRSIYFCLTNSSFNADFSIILGYLEAVINECFYGFNPSFTSKATT